MTPEEYGMRMRMLEERIQSAEQELRRLYQEQDEIQNSKSGMNQMLERHDAICERQRRAMGSDLLNGNAALRGFRAHIQELYAGHVAAGRAGGAIQSVAALTGRQRGNEQRIEELKWEIEALSRELDACAQERLRALAESAEGSGNA